MRDTGIFPRRGDASKRKRKREKAMTSTPSGRRPITGALKVVASAPEAQACVYCVNRMTRGNLDAVLASGPSASRKGAVLLAGEMLFNWFGVAKQLRQNAFLLHQAALIPRIAQAFPYFKESLTTFLLEMLVPPIGGVVSEHIRFTTLVVNRALAASSSRTIPFLGAMVSEYLLPFQLVNGMFDPYQARIREQKTGTNMTITDKYTRPRVSEAVESMPTPERRRLATILLLHLVQDDEAFASFSAEFFIPELLESFRTAGCKDTKILTYSAVILGVLIEKVDGAHDCAHSRWAGRPAGWAVQQLG